MPNHADLLRSTVPCRCDDAGAVALDAGIDTGEHGQIRVCRDGRAGAAGVPIVHVDKGLFARREPVLDHAGEGMRPELGAHLLDPLVRLPRRDRCVAPEHQHAITPVEIGADLRLGETALVEVFKQFALALEPGIGGHQPTGDPARRRVDHTLATFLALSPSEWRPQANGRKHHRSTKRGLGLPPKNVQERLGHATITMTLDRYAHLFRGDDSDELDKAAQALLA